MKLLTRSLLVFLAALCLASIQPLLAGAEELKPLPVVYPTRKGNTRVELAVRGGEVSIPLEEKNGKRLFFRYSGRFYHWKGRDGPMLPGPMLKVAPGGKIQMVLTNDLGKQPPPDPATHTFSFHGPNTTNVHFHGMHSDPTKDDPFKVAQPGESLTYKISVPRDHEPGLHWYHTHSHGATYHQLMGGLFGPIDIGEGDFMMTPVHPFRGWDMAVLMIHLYRLTPSTECDGLPMEALDEAMGSTLPTNARIVDSSGKEYALPENLFLVNGQHRPTVSAAKGRPLLLRMAFASGTCFLNMSLPTQCDFHLTGVDGTQARRTRLVEHHWLYFTTATRYGVAVVCEKVSRFPVHRIGHPDDVLFYISVSDHGKKDTVMATFPITMPKYSPDYLYLGGQQRVHRDISFSQRDVPTPKPYYVIGQGAECSSLQNSSTCFYQHFTGQVGTNPEDYRGFAVPLRSVVTARVFGDPTDARPHPLHLHVNHFQFLSFEPRAGGMHENHTMEMYGVRKGQFRDTIPILDGVTTIRWQAATYTGEVVYHCHALHHEDRGMMVSYLVYSPLDTGGASPPSSAGGRKERQRAELRRRRIQHIVVIVVVTLLACAAALLWRRNRRRALESLANMKNRFAGRRDAGTVRENAPLLP